MITAALSLSHPCHAGYSVATSEDLISEDHPFVRAIDQDDSELVSKWIREGHPVLAKIKNKIHESFLERAASHASYRSFELLLTSVHAQFPGLIITDSRGTPLLVSLAALAVPGKRATPTYEKMIELMLSVFPLSAKAPDHAYIGDGRTALHQAAAVGNVSVLKLLMAHGAEVDAKNSSGETALHLAARFGHLGAAKYLISVHASINEKTKYTRATPLMAAAEMGHENIIRMLMISGAERDAKYAFGKTAPERFREYCSLYALSTKRR